MTQFILPFKRHAWGFAALSILLLLAALLVARVYGGPFFDPPAEYTGKLNFAQNRALKERGCNLVKTTANGNPLSYYCWNPEPKLYPAKQLIESLPRIGWEPPKAKAGAKLGPGPKRGTPAARNKQGPANPMVDELMKPQKR